MVRADRGDGLGWYSPAELSDQLLDFCFVIPMREDGSAFPEGYWIEVLLNDGKREILTFEFRQREDGTFALEHQSADIVFQEIDVPSSQRLIPYRGRFHHDDFAYQLLGLEPIMDEVYDFMLGGTEAFLIGCHPATHYQE